MFDQEDRPVKTAGYQLGQILDDMSVDEIERTVLELKAEIARLEAAARAKAEHLSAADALFGGKGA